MLLVAPGCFWLPLVALGCSWLLLVAPGRSWVLLVVPGCSWSVLAAPGRPSGRVPERLIYRYTTHESRFDDFRVFSECSFDRYMTCIRDWVADSADLGRADRSLFDVRKSFSNFYAFFFGMSNLSLCDVHKALSVCVLSSREARSIAI